MVMWSADLATTGLRTIQSQARLLPAIQTMPPIINSTVL
jgi:hypothetical protein